MSVSLGGATIPEPHKLDIPRIDIHSSSPPSGTTSASDTRNTASESQLDSLFNEKNGAGSYDVPPGSPKACGFVKRDPPFARAGGWSTEVDIVAVPAIGGEPEETWAPGPERFQDDLGGPPRKSQIGLALLSMTPMSPGLSAHPSRSYAQRTMMGKQEPAWLPRGIRNRSDMQKARILLYDHGSPKDDDTLKLLAGRLVSSIQELRHHEKENRPIFFVCHSTGGLVVKMALVEAQRTKNPILGDCYGITFFATPHRGSSYLSMPDFADNIAELMHLSRPIPRRIAKELKLDHHLLKTINSDFRTVATELQVWSFFETRDSDLTNPDLIESERFPFHAPITSTKSALLNLRHEVVYPLLSDHTNCASFGNGNDNAQIKEAYLGELAQSIKKACELNMLKHTQLNLEEHVKVEVNGFYQSTVLNSNNEKPIRVWSTSRSLSDFLRYGPAQLLKDRLAESTTQPRETQHMRHNSRAASLLSPGVESLTIPRLPRPTNHRSSDGVEISKAPGSTVEHQPSKVTDPQLASKPETSRSRDPGPTQGPELSTTTNTHSSTRHEPSKATDLELRTGSQLLKATGPPSFNGLESSEATSATGLQFTKILLGGQLSSASKNSPSLGGSAPDYGFPTVPLFRTNLFKPSQDTLSPDSASRPLEPLTVTSTDTSIDPSAPVNSLGLPIDEADYDRSPPRSTGSAVNIMSLRPIHRSRRHSEAPSRQVYTRPRTLPREAMTYSVRRGSEGAIAPISFLKPDISNQKLVWIHVPFNNPHWVKNVLERITIDKGRDYHTKLLSAELWKSKHVRGRHAAHHAYFMKPTCSLIGADLTSPPGSPRKSSGGLPGPVQMCLYVPYLHFDTYRMLVKRRRLVKRRVNQGRSRPVPQSIAKELLEFKVMWQFLGHDPPINSRRTLDQFGYPSLLDTRARDDDQMLYKMTKQRCSYSGGTRSSASQDLGKLKKKARTNSTSQLRGDEEDLEQETAPDTDENEHEKETEAESDDEDILDGNVLMVDQLWLWIVDSTTTLTFFPKKEPLSTDGRLYQQADLRNSIFNEVNADLTSRCENAFDLAALVALHAVTVLFERSSHPDLEVFRTFEEAISILTEKMTNSFKRFRARGFRDKAIDYHDAVRSTNIRAKHKREGVLAEKQNRENTSALLELRDIEDELHTMSTLFTSQLAAIKLMIGYYNRVDLKDLTANGLSFLYQAESKLAEYSNQAAKMIDSVKDTRDDFDKLLQMVQRQAQVDEVRLARLQADLASAQSRSVMIFTVFTVIFLPLTFFTGLFGMNVQEWGGSNFIHLQTIGSISIPTSFAIITIALITAWSTRMRRKYNTLSRCIQGIFSAIRKSTAAIFASLPAVGQLSPAEVRRQSFRDKREQRRLAKEAKKDASLLDDDFWESHVTGRDFHYRVPPQNRKSVSLARKEMMEKERAKATKGTETWKEDVQVGLGNSRM